MLIDIEYPSASDLTKKLSPEFIGSLPGGGVDTFRLEELQLRGPVSTYTRVSSDDICTKEDIEVFTNLVDTNGVQVVVLKPDASIASKNVMYWDIDTAQRMADKLSRNTRQNANMSRVCFLEVFQDPESKAIRGIFCKMADRAVGFYSAADTEAESFFLSWVTDSQIIKGPEKIASSYMASGGQSEADMLIGFHDTVLQYVDIFVEARAGVVQEVISRAEDILGPHRGRSFLHREGFSASTGVGVLSMNKVAKLAGFDPGSIPDIPGSFEELKAGFGDMVRLEQSTGMIRKWLALLEVSGSIVSRDGHSVVSTVDNAFRNWAYGRGVVIDWEIPEEAQEYPMNPRYVNDAYKAIIGTGIAKESIQFECLDQEYDYRRIMSGDDTLGPVATWINGEVTRMTASEIKAILDASRQSVFFSPFGVAFDASYGILEKFIEDMIMNREINQRLSQEYQCLGHLTEAEHVFALAWVYDFLLTKGVWTLISNGRCYHPAVLGSVVATLDYLDTVQVVSTDPVASRIYDVSDETNEEVVTTRRSLLTGKRLTNRHKIPL